MPSGRSATATRSRTQTSASRGAGPRGSVRPRRVTGRPSRSRVRWERVGRVALLLVLFVVAGLYVQHALAYWSARTQSGHEQSIVRGLQQDNARLSQQQRALKDPATIVLDARRLGMVRPGERPYVVTGLPSR